MHTSTSLIDTLHAISSDNYLTVLLFKLKRFCICSSLDIANVFVALYTCSYSCMCAYGYDKCKCIMSAVDYVKLYTVVTCTGYHCHVACNAVACISSQKNAAGTMMCLLATHLHALLNGLCKGSVDKALGNFGQNFGG